MKLTVTKKELKLLNLALDITFSDYDEDNFDGEHDDLLIEIVKLSEKIAKQCQKEKK